MSKTIGILGGMGSFATLHFFKTLLELSEPDEFRIIIDNAVHILERTKAVKEKREGEVTEDILKSFYHLSRMKADFVVVPCNQAHRWYRRIPDLFKMPWLNMIKIVSDAVKAQGLSRPLILGGYVTVTKKLYSEYLPGAVYLDDKGNAHIYEIIRLIKKGKHKKIDYYENIIGDSLILGSVDEVKQEIDCIILACTELPMLKLFNKQWHIPFIDSSLELARATIKYARE